MGAALPTNSRHICIKCIYVRNLEDDSPGEEIKFMTAKQNVRQPPPPRRFIKDVCGGLAGDHTSISGI